MDHVVTHPVVGLAVSLLAIRLLDLSIFWSGTLLFLSVNLKMLPLVSTIRVAPSLARLFLPWPTITAAAAPPDRDALFRPYSIGTSRACLLECDVNVHKSNSTYLVDLDVSRAELLTRRFARALRRRRGALVLGGVDISFRREIRPLQAYETRSSVLAWDKKWFYVLSYLVKPGAEVEKSCDGGGGVGGGTGTSGDPGWDWVEALLGMGEHAQSSVKSQVFAVAISKYVAKAGRRTIPPADLLEAGGYLGPGGEEERVKSIEAKRIKGLKILQSKFGN